MKKLLILAAMAGVALVSCVKNEPAPSVTDQHEITFAPPVTSVNTKANTYGQLTDLTDYPTTENFSVYAVWHSEAFSGWASSGTTLYMNKVETAYNSSLNGWDPAQVTGGKEYYWPKNGYLTFAAFSPSNVNATNVQYDATGLKLTGFQVAANSSQQIDVLFSQRSYDKQKSSTTNSNTKYDDVDIDFEHALSSIQFKAKIAEAYDGTKITLKKISVYGVYSKGDFNETIDETTPSTYKSTPTWNNHDAGSVIAEANAYEYYNSSTGKVLETSEWTMNGETDQTDLILLPQTLPETATIVVEYTIQSPTATSAIDIVLEKKIKDITPEWKADYRYTYHISVALDEIYFAPEVMAWTESDNHTVGI